MEATTQESREDQAERRDNTTQDESLRDSEDSAVCSAVVGGKEPQGVNDSTEDIDTGMEVSMPDKSKNHELQDPEVPTQHHLGEQSHDGVSTVGQAREPSLTKE